MKKRVEFLQIIEDGGEKAGSHRDSGPQAELVSGGKFLHVCLQDIVLAQDAAGVQKKLFPGLGDIQLPGKTLKETHLVMLLQLPDSLAHRGLGEKAVFGCCGHFAGLGHLHKDPQMPDSHLHSPFLLYFI